MAQDAVSKVFVLIAPHFLVRFAFGNENRSSTLLFTLNKKIEAIESGHSVRPRVTSSQLQAGAVFHEQALSLSLPVSVRGFGDVCIRRH